MPKWWFTCYRGNRWNRKRPATFLPMGKGLFKVLTAGGFFAMRYAPFRGVCKAAWFVAGQSFDESLRTAKVVWEVTSVKKVKVGDRSSVKHLAALESEMFREHLSVVEVLALLQYDDGTPRQPGYLGMWTQGATWFVRVTDKDAEAQITAEGRTAEEAWDNLALSLSLDSPPWEPCQRRRKGTGQKS